VGGIANRLSIRAFHVLSTKAQAPSLPLKN
jgi:hypothetical protein